MTFADDIPNTANATLAWRGGSDGQARQPRQSRPGTKETKEDEGTACTSRKAPVGMDSGETCEPKLVGWLRTAAAP